MIEIKIIEEWGFNVGDDVCLYDEEDEAVSESQENVEMHDDFENIENVEALAKKIMDDLQVGNAAQGFEVSNSDKVMPETTDHIGVHANSHTNGQSASASSALRTTEFQPQPEPFSSKDGLSMGTADQAPQGLEFDEAPTSSMGGSAPHPAAQTKKTDVGSKQSTTQTVTSPSSGPWSADWLQNSQQGNKGLISSKNKRLKIVVNASGRKGGTLSKNGGKKKAGGVLRHPVLTLKKVARLPIHDREEVMKVLRKSKLMHVSQEKINNRCRLRERVSRSLEAVNVSALNESSSLGSVNNDWSNWVALNGSEASKAADVQCIGKILGVSFPGTCQNNFSVLSRNKNVELGPVLMPIGIERDDTEVGV